LTPLVGLLRLKLEEPNKQLQKQFILFVGKFA